MDCGSQFGCKKVRRLLDNNDLVGTMGRVGAACDNAAAMESFFSLLQKNVTGPVIRILAISR